MRVTFELTEDQANMLLGHARYEGIKAQESLDRMTEFCKQYKSGIIPNPVERIVETTKQMRDMWIEIYLKLEENHECF